MKKIGRPAVYTGNLKRHIVALIRQHNANGAMRILRADAKDPLARHRNLKLVPNPLSISMPTLLGFAKEANVKLHVGRPSKKAA
jgi:hypothetical protein